jgi:integrase
LTVYLGQAAIEELKRIRKVPDNPHVITGHVEGQHLTDIQKPWRRIRSSAGLDDVRIHDLRHTFASHGVAMGQGLPIIGKLLGHTQPQTTSRYAHLAAGPALEAADRISIRLADSMQTNSETPSVDKAA